jgi:hypothetical protein
MVKVISPLMHDWPDVVSIANNPHFCRKSSVMHMVKNTCHVDFALPKLIGAIELTVVRPVRDAALQRANRCFEIATRIGCTPEGAKVVGTQISVPGNDELKTGGIGEWFLSSD